MNGKRQRDILRIIHLGSTVPLGFLVYAPTEEYGFIRPICQFLIIPLLSATGLWMWQQGRIRRLLGGGR